MIVLNVLFIEFIFEIHETGYTGIDKKIMHDKPTCV